MTDCSLKHEWRGHVCTRCAETRRVCTRPGDRISILFGTQTISLDHEAAEALWRDLGAALAFRAWEKQVETVLADAVADGLIEPVADGRFVAK